jgi:hypothetical protein
MNIYSVFLPPGSSSASNAEKAEFVRQGFSCSAFLVTPLWALRHGYWLALLLWLAWIFIVGMLSSVGNLDAGPTMVLYALGACAFGLEADRWRETQLSRKGLLLQGLTLGASRDEAESLYFVQRTPIAEATISGSRAPIPQAEANRNAATRVSRETDLLGLFPPQEPKI